MSCKSLKALAKGVKVVWVKVVWAQVPVWALEWLLQVASTSLKQYQRSSPTPEWILRNPSASREDTRPQANPQESQHDP